MTSDEDDVVPVLIELVQPEGVSGEGQTPRAVAFDVLVREHGAE